MFPIHPSGTISPTSLRPTYNQPQPQQRVFQTSHSFPLTSTSTTLAGASFASNAATIHPSEYLDRHAPIPEDWVIQLPSSPSAPPKFQPEVSLLIPDYDGLEEGDARLLRAASAMLAENDSLLLAQPQLIDFNTQPTFQRGPFRSWNSQPLQVISPLRIHPYTRIVIKDIPTSSPDSDQSFDTPLSERQRRRREQVSTSRRLFGIGTNSKSSGKGGIGEETFYGLGRGDEQHTPTPIRFAPLVRSTSKFSSLNDDDKEEVEEATGRELWSPELVDMEMDVGMKEVNDEEREREGSVVTVVLSTPIKEISPASKGSEFELVKDESDEEEYPASPFHPTPIKRVNNRRHSISTTPLKTKSNFEQEPLLFEDGENEVYETDGIEGRGRMGERNEKGYKKAEEFKKYLDGERSARDPRFDLKVFHWILTGCPEMQWSSTGYGIEIIDISAFYQSVLHKEAREKRESTGKIVSKRELPGKSSFERQLSGYGFKRVTTGKFMTIERPDLRRDNHDLLRKVQEVWQVIEHGSMMPKVKVEKTTTTHALRTQVRELQSEVAKKDGRLEQMEKLIKVLARGEIVTPSKFYAIGIKIPFSPADSDMDIDIDPKLLTPVNTHETRSKSTTIKSIPKTKAKTKIVPKTTSKVKGNSKVIAKSAKPKLQIKSTNIPSSPSPRSRTKSKSTSTSALGVQENTPIKSIAEVIKEGKRGRGKKRV